MIIRIGLLTSRSAGGRGGPRAGASAFIVSAMTQPECRRLLWEDSGDQHAGLAAGQTAWLRARAPPRRARARLRSRRAPDPRYINRLPTGRRARRMAPADS